MKSFVLAFAMCLVASLPTGAARAQMESSQPLPPEVLADTPDATVAAWLRGHVVADGPVAGGLTFTFPDSFYENRLFLLAESHGSAAPQVLDLELLTHLNARIGLTDYVAEVDPVQGGQLNAYLESGDEAVLDRVFDFWTRSGAQWGNTAFEAKVRGVRALNQSLPADRRIRFVGVDTIQDWPLLRSWIEGRGGVIDAAAWDAGDAKTRATLALAALAGRAEDAAGLVDLLTRTSAGTDRETAIFDTYAFAVRSGELANRPAYGLWGMFHAMQGPVNGVVPFAARIVRSDLPAHDKMTTITLLSLDSAVQIPAALPTGLQYLRLTDFNVDGPFVKVQDSATLRAASEPGRISVFRLDGAQMSQGDFTTVRTSLGQDFVMDPNLPSTAYFQYVGVFRGSDWAPPRE